AFEVTTTGDEVLAHKPDPEIYLLTVQKLGVDPENCLVIEDSLAGVESGTTAGCQVVGLISDYATEEELKKAGAKWTVESLEEVVDILNIP
ncbi:MAG: HAD family hydrolase, partial [Patescibacteria group bacterium]